MTQLLFALKLQCLPLNISFREWNSIKLVQNNALFNIGPQIQDAFQIMAAIGATARCSFALDISIKTKWITSPIFFYEVTYMRQYAPFLKNILTFSLQHK